MLEFAMSLPELLNLRRETVSSMTAQPHFLLRCSDIKVMECNDLFCKVLGLERQRIINTTLEELGIIYPSHLEYKNMERQILSLPNKQAFGFTVIPLELEGSRYHLFVLSEPLAETAASLLPPSDVLTRLFYHSPVPAVIILLANRIILEVNQSFLELIGYKRQDIIGRNVIKLGLLPDTRKFEAAERKLKQGQSALPVEEQLKCRNGLLRSVLVSAEPFSYHHQACTISAFVDITERKHTKEQLAKAIKAAIQDTEVFSHAVIEKLTELDNRTPDLQASELTQRERDVLGLLAEGLANDCIAKKLFLSEHTVRNYITHIYEKLGLHSRAEAVVWARERGLIASA